jgi:hypothetical protein
MLEDYVDAYIKGKVDGSGQSGGAWKGAKGFEESIRNVELGR